MSARPGWRLSLPRFFARHASSKSEPPKSVVNFRNMQRRRGGTFRTDVRVERKTKGTALHPDTLRQHMFATSKRISEIVRQESDANARFKKSETLLLERMAEWRTLARRIRFHHKSRTPLTPQHGAAAWNHVILLAIRAASPTAAWHLFCDMKRQGIRPTARTYAGFFQALGEQAHTSQREILGLASWSERLSKLYEGLEQLHKEAAAQTCMHDALSPHQVAQQRVLHELEKDPASIVTAFRHYISLLCTLGRYEEALQVFDHLCPDGYPATQDDMPRLPRKHFATVPMYTSFLRDLGLCCMPMPKKQQLIREVWRRWQSDIAMALRRGAPPLLDETAVKTLVWTLGMGQPRTCVQDICHLLGTYMGVSFRSFTDSQVHPVPKPNVHWKDAALLVDVLVFFDQQGAYSQLIDCYTHAHNEAAHGLDPSTVPKAAALYQKAALHVST
ncbi:hypothetical protein MCAP1_000020 [Malassezia caprae]|uniref:Pentatricopeptide repeat-containing protein n=1 Tax=Malassezia caprae TaxID=1381934 RepID=A0AAF0ITK7_9BASI|nr:hypothetical protein MCAP1_000020 [Malassezia caprae]